MSPNRNFVGVCVQECGNVHVTYWCIMCFEKAL